MSVLKWLLMAAGIAMFGTAAGVVGYDVYLEIQFQRLMNAGESGTARSASPRRPVRWPLAAKLFAGAWAPVLLALSIAIVPEGTGAVRVSQISGIRPEVLYPGVHLIWPAINHVAVYDLRDRLFTTAATADGANKTEVLTAQTREGLTIGLAVAVRYRLDARRLPYIHGNLAQPVDTEIVGPVVTTVFRDIAPHYIVRDAFAAQRDDFRDKAAQAITARLASDGIVVKEVLLRDIRLPAEYSKGLDSLLMKEQESERMGFETAIQEKQVHIAELNAEADKARQVKRAEADAAARVIAAKAESDAMQYTLPLKQKQIEQTKLEAQARKEATVENAEAAAESKIIDSKAEVERRKLLTAADADGIRLTAAADNERMQQEAVVLKENPLLIQKIIAERLSDKLQIIMVPTDGRNFFAADVLQSAFAGGAPANKTGDADSDAATLARKQAEMNRSK